MPLQDNPLGALNAAGQSVWYDHIHRAMLTDGELTRLVVEDDLRGVTSNPSIFEQAIAASADYAGALQRALKEQPNGSSRALFYALAIEDIGAAADQLRPVYQATDGVDGMVSLEVSPDLADDAEATIREARDLNTRVNRPNVMIKVPATEAGLAALEQLTAEGINVNVTLLFAVERYVEVAEAYLRGLERRLEGGQSVASIASVASFFISRIDSALDPRLAEKQPELQGKIAIANAKLAYQRFKTLFRGDRFSRAAAAGARPQRLLWASTSTKNPSYSDVLYVEALIGPQTVNTMPPATYDAFRDHGVVMATLEDAVDVAEAQLAALPQLGIDLRSVTGELEAAGVAALAKAFDNLLAAIEAKTARLAATA